MLFLSPSRRVLESPDVKALLNALGPCACGSENPGRKCCAVFDVEEAKSTCVMWQHSHCRCTCDEPVCCAANDTLRPVNNDHTKLDHVQQKLCGVCCCLFCTSCIQDNFSPCCDALPGRGTK